MDIYSLLRHEIDRRERELTALRDAAALLRSRPAPATRNSSPAPRRRKRRKMSAQLRAHLSRVMKAKYAAKRHAARVAR